MEKLKGLISESEYHDLVDDLDLIELEDEELGNNGEPLDDEDCYEDYEDELQELYDSNVDHMIDFYKEGF